MTYIDDDSAEATQREGDCQFQGAVRLANSALLAWKESEVLLEGYDILLATIAVRHCMLEEDPSLATRQDIQGCAVPYTAAGIASSDELRWEAWPSAADPAGIEAVVNTEPAGFNAVPAYQAQIASAADPAQVPALAGYAHIVSSQPADFRLRVHLPPVDPFFHELTLKEEHFGGILQLLRTQTDSAIGGKDKKNKVLYSINPDRLSPHDLEVGSTLTVPTKLIRISGKWHVDEVNLTIDLRRVLDHAPEDYRTDDIDEQIAWLIRLNQALGIDLTTSDVSVPDEAFNPGDIVTSISDIITGGILNS
ncbi:MAG: hypothetical protein GY946_27060, partial [bacterium]|nr:hypothetical protein [bacterium]